MAEGVVPLLLPEIGQLPGPILRSCIESIAGDIGDSPYLLLATLHLARCVYEPGEKKSESALSASEGSRGVKRAHTEVGLLIDSIAQAADWDELQEASRFVEYHTFRRIVANQYRTPASGEERTAFFCFLAVLLIYVVRRGEHEPNIRRSPPYQAVRLFHIEDYINKIFDISPNNPVTSYQFPKSQGRVSSIIDVLQEELGIANPIDPGIGLFFHLASPPDNPTRYVCYRYTTRFRRNKDEPNHITKSYFDIHPPRGQRAAYSFTHVYMGEDRIPRRTTGFVVKLAQAFYLVGGSQQGETPSSVGIKVLAIPTDEAGTWYDHNFISGLYLSNDSALNPIVGRILLARAKDGTENPDELYCGRILESAFGGDITMAASRANLTRDDQRMLLSSLKNFGKGADIETALTPFKKLRFR